MQVLYDKTPIFKKFEDLGLLHSQSHPTLPLTIYNYTDKVQWENLWDWVTLMCRGLVVDNYGNIIARPFSKFFNLSEGKTKITDNYEIFEKLDGSLGILFWYSGEWILASRGSFTSEQAIRGKDILDKTCNYELLDKNNTYCFEIIYPENKIVVDYNGMEKCVLIGVFNTETGKEQPLDNWGLEVASSLNLDCPLDLLHTKVKNNEEGYVVRFSNGGRCKIKGSEYLRLHKMMSEMSTTSIWECLKNGDNMADLLQGFPDEFFIAAKEYENSLLSKFNNKITEIRNEFKMINMSLGECSDKTFALFIKDNPLKSFLFSLRAGRNIEDSVWKYIKPKYGKL